MEWTIQTRRRRGGAYRLTSTSRVSFRERQRPKTLSFDQNRVTSEGFYQCKGNDAMDAAPSESRGLLVHRVETPLERQTGTRHGPFLEQPS